MSIIRVDVGPGDWVVVWHAGGGAPQLIAPSMRPLYRAKALICRESGPIPHLSDHCPALACQVDHAWQKHFRENVPH